MFTLVFLPKIWRSICLMMLRLALLFALAGFAASFMVQAVFAHHKDVPEPCYDITDQGTDVLVARVANSGKLIFDPAGGSPLHGYEACLSDPGNDALGMFDFKGWAWNDNLGWVSFYCDGADNNLGRPCGNIAYGLQMEGTDQLNPGRLHGCAWADNIGWISFNGSDASGACGGGGVVYYVQVEMMDEACLGEVKAGGCPNNGTESTYAWADSVGWLDLTGVKFPVFELVTEALDVTDVDLPWIKLVSGNLNVTFELKPEPDIVNKITAPVANGEGGYEMLIYFKDSSGAPVDVIGAPYKVNINVLWSEDTVKLDQTNAHWVVDFKTCKNNASGGVCNAQGGSAVDKPLKKDVATATATATNHFMWDATLGAYKATITAVAPTSGVNGYDKNGDGTVDYSYEKFALGNPGGDYNVQPNNLKLADVKVSVLNTDTSICVFGGTGCLPKFLNTGSQILQFRPAVEVAQFVQNNQDFLHGRVTVANDVVTTTVCMLSGGACDSALIDFRAGIDVPFALVIPTGEDGATIDDPKNLMNYNIFGSATLPWTPVCKGEGACGEFGENPYIYSVVKYTALGKSVKYFSNKLPRVKGTLVVNPVATIAGSVYSTGVTNPQTGKVIRSLGDVGTNILRNTVFRNVSGIIAGAKRPGSTPVTLIPDLYKKGFEGFGGEVTALLPDKDGTAKVYYFRGDVKFDTGSKAITWHGDRTVIVIGGNVYIKSDLYNGDNGVATPKSKLGIIVLKDFATGNVGKGGNGGNVYVAPNVKNIQANIFADGSFFSYDGTNLTPEGLPYFDNEDDRYNTLLNQLYLQGTLATQNTIGGAVKTSEPILGDGTQVSAEEGVYGDIPSGRAKARLYDLNFLRYFGYVFERDADPLSPTYGDAIDKDGDEVLEATPESEGGDLVLNPAGEPAQGLGPDQASAVHVEFDPPTHSLPGFGVAGGVDVKLKPQ